MLRSFVANDAYSENDLSTCLRQANYNVELAAEQLITGQFQPTKRQRTTSERSNVAKLHVETPNALSSKRLSSTTRIRKPTPVTPKTPSPMTSITVTKPPVKKPLAPISEQKQNPHPLIPSTKDSWLLCHRWISDGVCLQRNGCVAYQEPLFVEHSLTSATSNKNAMLRFRGDRILGQFPKHLNPLLGPLLEENWIQIEAQALMEERFLPIGADVAFAIWCVSLPTTTLKHLLHFSLPLSLAM